MALWVIDSQPSRRWGLNENALIDVIRSLGHQVIEVVYDPESGESYDELKSVFNLSPHLILRGSVGFAAWAHNNYSISPGAFPSTLMGAATWLPIYGDLALNANAVITTYGDFERRRVQYENQLGGAIFIKPAGGGKLISGIVLEPERPLFDAHYSKYRRWQDVPDDYPVILAQAQTVYTEWRFVIANREIIAKSQYKFRADLETSTNVPDEAVAFADKIAKHQWQPSEVFVTDVASTPAGYKLVELNTFGTSGLYECDLRAIVKAVSPYA